MSRQSVPQGLTVPDIVKALKSMNSTGSTTSNPLWSGLIAAVNTAMKSSNINIIDKAIVPTRGSLMSKISNLSFCADKNKKTVMVNGFTVSPVYGWATVASSTRLAMVFVESPRTVNYDSGVLAKQSVTFNPNEILLMRYGGKISKCDLKYTQISDDTATVTIPDDDCSWSCAYAYNLVPGTGLYPYALQQSETSNTRINATTTGCEADGQKASINTKAGFFGANISPKDMAEQVLNVMISYLSNNNLFSAEGGFETPFDMSKLSESQLWRLRHLQHAYADSLRSLNFPPDETREIWRDTRALLMKKLDDELQEADEAEKAKQQAQRHTTW